MPRSRRFVGKHWVDSRFTIGIALVLLVAVALFLRVYLPYDKIFVGDWVKFAGVDDYYYMRLVDNMTNNFPHLMTVDPYLAYPDGQAVGSFTFFARLLASVSWLIGLGSPSQHLVDVVSAYVPAILGALVVVPVYFIGRELAGKWVGLISAGFIAVVSGEFLGRSILGFTDHHVAEVLFSTMAVLFLIVAVKSAKSRGLSFGNLSWRPIVFSVLAGFFLGVYLLTWIGGLLFVFIIGVYCMAQLVVSHFGGKPVDYLPIVGSICFAVAMVMFLPTAGQSFYALSMGVLTGIWVLWGISRLMAKAKPMYYAVSVVGLGIIGLVVFRAVSPALFDAMLSVVVPSSTQATTIEMQPLLWPFGSFSLAVAWSNFGVAFFIVPVSLVVLAYLAVKRGDTTMTFIVVWGIVILAMALVQRRFAYYLAVNVAVLTGCLFWLGLEWAGFGKLKGKRSKANILARGVNIGLVSVIVSLAVFLPIIPSAVGVASRVPYAPSDAWYESLDWLKGNSPEPFGGADAYYELDGQGRSSYAVLAWWDYGYWIARIARRVPVVNPSQNPAMQAKVASFLTSQEGESVSDVDAKYVVIDFDTVTGKFWAIARYAGDDESDYLGVYYVANGNQVAQVLLYYPEYYRSLAVRLYNFGGKAVVPQNVIAMVYEPRTDGQGKVFNMVTDARQFATYGEAQAFVSSQQSGNWRIVGNNPFISPVPLEAVRDYKMFYTSRQKKPIGDGEISEVKIFERIE